MTMASTDSISYFYEIFSQLGPFKKSRSPDSSDESEEQGTELDIERYTGSKSAGKSSAYSAPPSASSSRKGSTSREPGRLFVRKKYTDAENNTSPGRYLMKDPFSIKSDIVSDSTRNKYDSKRDRYDKYDSPSESRHLMNNSYSRENTSRVNDFTSRNANDVTSRNAPLSKYEIRSYKDPSKNLKSSDYLSSHSDRANTLNSDYSPRTERYSTSLTRKALSTKSDTNDMAGAGCAYCARNQTKLKTAEEKLENEMEATKILFRQKGKLEEQIAELNKKIEEEAAKPASSCNVEEMENLKLENEKLNNELKNVKKELRKKEKLLETETTQVNKLTIKLEDANFEKERLRTELINSQFENEKVIEENEDLAVDNEDLIKERDEILQIYDELFRESERLKHEVQIWKGVFQANQSSFPSEVVIETDQPAEKTAEDEGLFNPAWTIEEDPSLLLQPRHDLTIKKSDPAKVLEISKDEIGRGKFGKLYRAVAYSTGDLYTAKYIKVTQKLHEDVMSCIEVMKKLHHIQLMNLFDVYDLDSQIVMILEYVGGGTLFERIVKNNSLTEADCKIYVKQLLQGVYHMHSQNIVHLEITPENIVCVDNQSMQFKLIDFGRAKQLVHGKETKITAGSPEFLAPEILSFDPVSLASDMWSIGVIAYVLLSGISPFIGDDDQDTLMNVSEGEYTYDSKAFQNISQTAKDFIDELLIVSPRKRNNVTACLNHQWMKIDAEARRRKIDTSNMASFLKKRKEKPQVSAGRAIRRFSSIAVGPKKVPMRPTSPSPFLNIPTMIDSIAEDDEEDEKEENSTYTNIPVGIVPRSGPVIQITESDSTDGSAPTTPSHEQKGPPMAPFEDTDSADSLRNYLQQMIDMGHLPGSRGSISGEAYSEESGNEEE